MPNSTILKTLTLSDGTYNNTLPLEDTTARSNITSLANSLAAVATSGSYNDLTDVPDIPETLLVEFTENSNIWTCDTPIYEICQAIEDKRFVVGRMPSFGYNLLVPAMYYYEPNDSAVVAFILNSNGTSIILQGNSEYNQSWADQWIYNEFVAVDLDTYTQEMATKQDELISGTNIKTINGQSLLGSGNISIQGGGGGGDVNVIEVVKVNGSALVPDANKAVDVITYCFATSSTAAATVQKEVSIPSITSLNAGQIIVVQPTVTSTVANSTLKLNDFAAYPMRYNNAAITTSTDAIVWSASFPSIWLFDGTYWVFLGHGVDSNTTYSAMSVDEGTTGTATSGRVMRADYLKQIIQTYIASKADIVANAIDGDIAALDAEGNLVDGGVAASSVQTAVSHSHSHSNKEYLDKIPSSIGSNGQVLTSNGTSWLWQTPSSGGSTSHDYTHTPSTYQSGTVAVTFAANQKCSVMYGASADLALAITCNNGADNYIWVQNTGTADIDITISSVTYNNSSLAAGNIFLPSDGITVPKGCVCEIGVLCNADGAFITARGDLKASS